MLMHSALFVGTFGPPSLGHLDIIERSSLLFEKLFVGIAVNSSKKCPFSIEMREEMVKMITQKLTNVHVLKFEGLTIDLAKELKVNCLIRGLRNGSDFDYEIQHAQANKKMGNVETLFLTPSEKFVNLSSSLIQDIAQNKMYLDQFIPKEISVMVYEHLKKREL
jgi:pantetheine-phosphate adenylyltransferase